MNVTFDHSHTEAPGIVTFFFRPQEPFHYAAGQYVTLALPHKNPDDRGIKRQFTLSSSPSQPLLSITTRIPERDASTFTRSLVQLKTGDSLAMSKAQGTFFLPEDQKIPLLFIAGGIGITPFHSILTWLADSHETRPIRLLYTVNTARDVIFRPSFQSLQDGATVIIKDSPDSWAGTEGILNAQHVLRLGQISEDTLVYLSGPATMVKNLAADLTTSGVNRDQLLLDIFRLRKL